MNHRKCLLLLLAFAVGSALPFVVQPVKVKQRRAEVAVEVPALELKASLTNPTGKTNEQEGFLAKAANKIASWLPFKLGKKEEEEEVGLTRLERNELAREMKDLTAPFPWPVRALTDSITRTVHRELVQEERKAKPLLRRAVQRINADDDVRVVLGTPIKHGRMISQSTEKTVVNRKKTVRIVDTFEVVGSQSKGVATLIADKYAAGHLQALRVDVQGIHYDIDV